MESILARRSCLLHQLFEHVFVIASFSIFLNSGTLIFRHDMLYHCKTYSCLKLPFRKQIDTSMIHGSLLASFSITSHFKLIIRYWMPLIGIWVEQIPKPKLRKLHFAFVCRPLFHKNHIPENNWLGATLGGPFARF